MPPFFFETPEFYCNLLMTAHPTHLTGHQTNDLWTEEIS